MQICIFVFLGCIWFFMVAVQLVLVLTHLAQTVYWLCILDAPLGITHDLLHLIYSTDLCQCPCQTSLLEFGEDARSLKPLRLEEQFESLFIIL